MCKGKTGIWHLILPPNCFNPTYIFNIYGSIYININMYSKFSHTQWEKKWNDMISFCFCMRPSKVLTYWTTGVNTIRIGGFVHAEMSHSGLNTIRVGVFYIWRWGTFCFVSIWFILFQLGSKQTNLHSYFRNVDTGTSFGLIHPCLCLFKGCDSWVTKKNPQEDRHMVVRTSLR